MGIRDQVRAGVKQDLQKLKSLGVKNLIVLSGDNQGTVNLVKKTNYIKSSEKQNQNSECFEMRDNNCNK